MRDNSERGCRRSCVAFCVTQDFINKNLRKNMQSFKLSSPEKDDTPKEESSSVAKGVVSLLVLGVGGWFLFGGGLEQQASRDLDKIEDQVAVDFVNQYNLAKKSGDAIQICVQAGMVSAGYLQAEDQANYLKWKEIEKADCKNAGM